jgi:hypothetical protein
MKIIITILAIIGLITVICFFVLLVLLCKNLDPDNIYYDRADYTIMCRDCKKSSCNGCSLWEGGSR